VEDGIVVRKSALNAFDFDATDTPDLFPPLVALASVCKGRSTIIGADRLRIKESDRAMALTREFRKMGTKIDVDGDKMSIEGGAIAKASVESNGDHRIVMAAAVAALKGDGEVLINGAEAVQKSYPSFFTDLEQLGGVIR